MPKGWEEQMRMTGAMQRVGVVASAEELLRLNMLYVTNDGSFQSAAVGMALTTGKTLSKVAAFKRIKNSGSWLRWMAKELMLSDKVNLTKPDFLGKRDVVLIDASEGALKGGVLSSWRLHYSFDLFNFQCRDMEVTKISEGERLTRHKINSNDIILADRMYCTINGMEYVASQESRFAMRFRVNAFYLYDEKGYKQELLPQIRHLEALESIDKQYFYKNSNGQLKPVRIVVMKKDAAAIEARRKKICGKIGKSKFEKLSPDTEEFNEYIAIATNLDYSNEQILELYRARWQVEQVFFRLKSLFGYGEIPSKRDDTVQAWFYGKLLLAALCECILKRMPFPPETEPYITDIVGAKFMV